MDEIAVVSLALTLAFQAKWQAKQRNANSPISQATRTYTREDAVTLGRRFGHKFTRGKSSKIRNHDWLLRHVDAVAQEIQRYEDPHLQELALSVLPFDDLNERAVRIKDAEGLMYQDALAQALVEWAKKDFFKWADPVKCSLCGGETEGIAGGSPTTEERSFGASRVELYRCIDSQSNCHGHITRFPRYSSLEKLLQTRTGRCGEFAAVFMLLLRSLNLRARYIWNSEDHVWNEYYSDHLRRWVHLDSCEGARDKNLLYDQGWGKKMKYCIAFGVDCARDVTKSYVSNWQETLSRRDAGIEQALSLKLMKITESLRQNCSAEEKAILHKEDAEEETWLSDFQEREKIASQGKLSGRTSGTREWRTKRSEIGGSKTAFAKPAMIPLRKVAGSDADMPSITSNGSARLEKDRRQIILTEDRPDQIASAFLALPDSLQEYIFTCTFTISHRGSEGADGMALVMHSDPRSTRALGQGGCDLGYGGLTRCLAVEIDTYRSVDRCEDPPTPHISVHTAGPQLVSAHHKHSIWCSKPSTLPELDDGRPYMLRLEVSHTLGELRLFFNDSSEGEFVELTDEPVSISDIFHGGSPACLGWTAATGGLHQAHVIESFELWEAQSREDGR